MTVPDVQTVTSALATSKALETYRARAARFEAEAQRLTRRWQTVANIRLVVFVVTAAAALWGIWQRDATILVSSAVPAVVFAVLVGWHAHLSKARARLLGLLALTVEAEHRARRNWVPLPIYHRDSAPPLHAYAYDLDLFGQGSLFHLLDSAGGMPGEKVLAGWLLHRSGTAEIRARQEAVAELAPMIDLRDDLTLQGRQMGQAGGDPKPLLEWAEGKPWLAGRRWLLPVSVISVAALWLLVAAQVAGLIGYPFWVLVVLFNLLLGTITGGSPYAIVSTVGSKSESLRGYAHSLALITGAGFTSPALTALANRLRTHGATAGEQVEQLWRIVRLSIPRGAMLYGVFQAFTLWDIFVLAALERWQVRAGQQLRVWLDTMAEVQALAALAVLKHDNSGWCFPVIDDSAAVLQATGLGHPLLPDSTRVVNDATVGPAGTFVLVTGSNMSGKSTFLRSIGVNTVLALAGGPVCATSMTLPPVSLWTSMRVQDSLLQGVSFFMAELQRLKAVVDAARAGRKERIPALYLLDEILQGTNTAERQIAARRIIRTLVDLGALGAVSTHDLTLAAAPDLTPSAQMVHFTETVHTDGNPAMTFDYRVRPGPAHSTNALKLMQMVGLDLDGTEPARDQPGG